MRKRILTRFRAARFARDTVMMSVSNGLRLFFQALYFIIIAHTLGSAEYGRFVGMCAVVAILAPFAGLGSSSILIKNVSRDRTSLPLHWGNGLFLIILTGVLFSLLLIGVTPYIWGYRYLISVVCICVSELLLARMVELSSFACTAVGRMKDTGVLNLSIGASRLLGVLVLCSLKKHPTVQDWCAAILASSVVCCLCSIYHIWRMGRIAWDFKVLRTELRDSAYFSIGASAATIYNDIDKSMLARLADLSSAGIYAAAYRCIDVSMAPVRAMTACSYAEFFRRGMAGPSHSFKYAVKLMRTALPIGLGVFIGLFVAAPLLPYIVGHSFRDSVEALRWLAFIPLLRSGHLFMGDALSGCGYNRTRTSVQVSIAAINIGLNFYFIPQWGWRGAAWTSIICDGLLLIGFLLSFAWIGRSRRTYEFSPVSALNLAKILPEIE